MSKSSSAAPAAATLPLPPKSPKRPKVAMPPTSNLEPLHITDPRISTATSSTAVSDTTTKGKQIMRDISRGTPGDGYESQQALQMSPEQRQVNKQRSLYFEGVFAGPGRNVDGARERVERESMVVVELRTNVIVSDEYSLITTLSHQLSTRYQRPESCIAISVAHSGCLMFGASYNPAYLMTISALPSLLQPVTNKRNAALLAKELSDILGVAPDRGCIIFRPVVEECFARGGMTVIGEIEEMERVMAEEGRNSGGARRSGEKGLGTPGRGRKKKSMRSLRGGKEENGYPAMPVAPSMPEDQRMANGEQARMGGGKRYEDEEGDQMPLPERKFERGAKKVSKRKSFINAVFRKY